MEYAAAAVAVVVVVVVIAVLVEHSLKNPAVSVFGFRMFRRGEGNRGGQNRVPCIPLIPHCEALHLQID